MNIADLAGMICMSTEEFQRQVVTAMASIGLVELSSKEYDSDTVSWDVEYNGITVQVIVRKT
jgi:hypothetical protein